MAELTQHPSHMGEAQTPHIPRSLGVNSAKQSLNVW